MPKRPCIDCGGLALATRCPDCKRAHRRNEDRLRGSRHFRGYDREHERLRAETLRDTPYCVDCGHDGSPDNPLSADHIKPLSEGGRTQRDNYMTLCRRCNSRKGANVLTTQVEGGEGGGGHPLGAGSQDRRDGRSFVGGKPFTGGNTHV